MCVVTLGVVRGDERCSACPTGSRDSPAEVDQLAGEPQHFQFIFIFLQVRPPVCTVPDVLRLETVGADLELPDMGGKGLVRKC